MNHSVLSINKEPLVRIDWASRVPFFARLIFFLAGNHKSSEGEVRLVLPPHVHGHVLFLQPLDVLYAFTEWIERKDGFPVHSQLEGASALVVGIKKSLINHGDMF